MFPDPDGDANNGGRIPCTGNTKWKTSYYYTMCSAVKGAIAGDPGGSNGIVQIITKGECKYNSNKREENCFIRCDSEDKIKAETCQTHGRQRIASPTHAQPQRTYFLEAIMYDSHRKRGQKNVKKNENFERNYVRVCGRMDQVVDDLPLIQAHSGYGNVMQSEEWMREQEIESDEQLFEEAKMTLNRAQSLYRLAKLNLMNDRKDRSFYY